MLKSSAGVVYPGAVFGSLRAVLGLLYAVYGYRLTTDLIGRA